MKLLKITTLEKGWSDRDEVLLHAAFQILVDFVRGERPEEVIDWSADKTHQRAWREIMNLYRWWRETRPARRSPLEERKIARPPRRSVKIPGTELTRVLTPDRKKYADYYGALSRHSQLVEKWYEEDQRNLHRLVEIRSYLWT